LRTDLPHRATLAQRIRHWSFTEIAAARSAFGRTIRPSACSDSRQAAPFYPFLCSRANGCGAVDGSGGVRLISNRDALTQRDHHREKFWRRTIRQQQRSGLSAGAFWLRERLKYSAFRWWRQALARIRQLYKIEHDAAELSAENRRALRQRDARPLLNAFEEWLTEQRRKALPKSPIGQAIAYTQSNWAALLRYTEHGELRIDNNNAERMLRAQAIGRRDWTFPGSARGGRTAAVLPGGRIARGMPDSGGTGRACMV